MYGTKQVPDEANTPGGVDSAFGWVDQSGRFWMYGGHGYDSNGAEVYFNDVWEYQPTVGGLPTAATPTFSVASGSYAQGQTLSIYDTTPGASIYYVATGTPTATKYTTPITLTATESLSAVAVASGYSTSAVASGTFTVPVVATPTISLASGTYTSAQTFTLSDSTPGAIIFYIINEGGGTQAGIYYGPMTVPDTETLEVFATASGYATSAHAFAQYTIWPTSSANEWAWMGGLNAGAASPVAGTQGVAAAGNIPDARYQATSWTDKSGNFWLFGGWGGYGGQNDLWKFDPSISQWAWMSGNTARNCAVNTLQIQTCSYSQPGVYGTQGVAAVANAPGGRFGASSWVDANGNFWIFGGDGLDANGSAGGTILNDLWKYNSSTNQWTWVSGSTIVGNRCFSYDIGEKACSADSVFGTLGVFAAGNTPGSREDATTWTDNKGNLWLFGGWGYDVPSGTQYYYDELWEFNPVTSQWAWMGGSSTKNGSACIQNVNLYYLSCGEPGTYGTIATPASGNIPGGRQGSISWTDTSGNLWLFSGNGFDATGTFGDPNDLWEYNPSTNQWAWMGGRSLIPGCSGYNCSSPGVLGTQGTPSAGNMPRGRDHGSSWVDAKGNFWMYSGGGSTSSGGSANETTFDLWEYTPSANEWTWMGNSGQVNKLPNSVYGTPGLPAAANGPGTRWGQSGWTDSKGYLWLFGGQTPFALSVDDNDLWQYAPSAPAPVPGFALADWSQQTLSAFQIAAGGSGTTTVSTIVAGGFSGAIAMSTSGLPSGITASFTPASVTGFANVQPTFTVGSTVNPGTYSLTVVGTSGGVTQTTTVKLTVTSAPADFTFGSSASSLTVKAGSSGAVTLTVTPANGFGAPVSFACSGLPTGASCAFSPQNVTPSGAAVSTTLTISTLATTAAVGNGVREIFPVSALALAFCIAIGKKRRALSYLMLAAVVGGLGLAIGCSGGSGQGGGGGGGGTTTPTTSSVTVTASSGTLQHTATITLTVN